MKNMQEMMNDALDKIAKDGFIEKTLKEQIEKTVEGIISELFRSYGDFAGEVKEAIKNQLKIDLSNLGLEDYSTELTKMIRMSVQGKMDKDMKNEVENLLVKIGREEIPEEIKISELIEKLVTYWLDDDEEKKYEGFEFSFHIKQRWPEETNTLSDYMNIYIDKEEDKEPNECDINISFSKKDMKISDITAYSREIGKDLMLSSSVYGEMQYLFRLYARNVKLIDDSNEVDVCVSGECDY